MASKSPLRIILGAANIGDTYKDKLAKFGTPEEVKSFLDYFYDRGYNSLDTARAYSPGARGTSEPLLGVVGAGKRFNIDTKILPHVEHPHTRDKIERNINESLEALRVSQVDVEYLHRPDRTTPFEETCEAMNKAYIKGKFRRFGISNHTAEEVEQLVRICEERGFIKPTVYQGQYNPIVRGGENDLFPVLRKHGIAFYAWSPAGAGIFAGKHRDAQPGGRYDTSHPLGELYASWYVKPNIVSAVDRAVATATKFGISGHAAALRWTLHHGILDGKHGDGIIIGASSTTQLEQNLDIVEAGPLPKEVVEAMNDIYSELAGEEISYHF
ncbi:NADP-dependent oxidoreductase domain-containing protein [Talaromyces proteolyticus]|uniref:NADP-dependent oxidoreductase domain-containing protein n=1 Tax=Talaromyces proteolyticus TaxID=1131652 RepID=A0AAD4KLN3_9EURO|nr:NADP-dependent oxidoreductase domain-containing protein [Talaromyces proteolyticus]KAH8695538.1 NADP-dependent oxidoreductase domain-containing protein [Talaromyces proteolyticus]